ncbi:hypothetical protein [Methyloceanibacter sp. wino2]|uniref:hypothetical protein n=1 Tax=Methyloceanibacter sp. wino2 TaxID=2170729 RepID=UPI000D3EB38B|nr:hypothetical protein [Methyloceanibacter sp. wino2]
MTGFGTLGATLVLACVGYYLPHGAGEKVFAELTAAVHHNFDISRDDIFFSPVRGIEEDVAEESDSLAPPLPQAYITTRGKTWQIRSVEGERDLGFIEERPVPDRLPPDYTRFIKLRGSYGLFQGSCKEGQNSR